LQYSSQVAFPLCSSTSPSKGESQVDKGCRSTGSRLVTEGVYPVRRACQLCDPGKLVKFSEPQFSHLQGEGIEVYLQEVMSAVQFGPVSEQVLRKRVKRLPPHCHQNLSVLDARCNGKGVIPPLPGMKPITLSGPWHCLMPCPVPHPVRRQPCCPHCLKCRR
jgi:hypothetical protein